jgi:hypothetical protein
MTDTLYHPTNGHHYQRGVRVAVRHTAPRYALRGTVLKRLDSVNVVVRWDNGETRTEVDGIYSAIERVPDGVESTGPGHWQ